MRRLLIAMLALPLFLVSCEPSNPDYEPPVRKDPPGSGNNAFLRSETKAWTGKATQQYDTANATLNWQVPVTLDGTMPRKVIVVALFVDASGKPIITDRADPVVLAPGEKTVMKHGVKITKEQAAKIADWDINIDFVRE